ncbi:MAG: phasin family protein [Thermodesulfovibrionales bacterium]
MSVFDVVRKALLAGIGVQEKVKEFIDELIKKGELSEAEGAKLIKEWTEKAEKSTEGLRQSITGLVNSTLEKMKLPTREEIERLEKKIDRLSERLKKLEGEKAEEVE